MYIERWEWGISILTVGTGQDMMTNVKEKKYMNAVYLLKVKLIKTYKSCVHKVNVWIIQNSSCEIRNF